MLNKNRIQELGITPEKIRSFVKSIDEQKNDFRNEIRAMKDSFKK